MAANDQLIPAYWARCSRGSVLAPFAADLSRLWHRLCRSAQHQFAIMIKRASVGITVALVSVVAMADTSTLPCTCGPDAAHYPDWITDQAKPTHKDLEPAWCRNDARVLLDAAYEATWKVPAGFQGNIGTDFDRIVSVYWVTHPSAPGRAVACIQLRIPRLSRARRSGRFAQMRPDWQDGSTADRSVQHSGRRGADRRPPSRLGRSPG